jgi:hypothetical protein
VREEAPHLVAAVHAVTRRPARRGRHALHPQPIERIVPFCVLIALSSQRTESPGVPGRFTFERR